MRNGRGRYVKFFTCHDAFVDGSSDAIPNELLLIVARLSGGVDGAETGFEREIY